MAARRYEISLRVLKNIRERVKYFQHEKRNFVSPSVHVVFYLLHKHQWNTKPFHWNSFFPRKGKNFHVWRYHAFARKLTWYFIGIYIIKGIHSLHLHYLYLGILFNSTALILKLELVVVNWFVGNQHTLGVFIWQNFASGRMFLKESMQVVLDHRLFPSSQSPYDTKRPQCGGEMHDWKNAITFANLFLGKTQYYLFNQKMIS